LRVLLAEDDATSRVMLRALLTKWGYEVTDVGDGDSAWSLLQQDDAPKLALLDWMMLGLDGPAVCRLVAGLETARPPYVILVTGRSETSDVVDGLRAGASDYVAKPYVAAELRARVEVGRRMIELQERLHLAMNELNRLAITDQLTVLLNRGAILERLRCEMTRGRGPGATLWVSMLDLDHFKRVNDRFGHLAGDAVLRACSKRIADACGATTSVGRYGGEEFLIIAPERSPDRPPTLFETIRKAIADEPVRMDGIEVRVTASEGIAAWNGRDDLGDLIRQADEALYRAKRNGRNTVIGDGGSEACLDDVGG
jgi:two-component system, cell cycle response regulator